jgi:hypothetical protein
MAKRTSSRGAWRWAALLTGVLLAGAGVFLHHSDGTAQIGNVSVTMLPMSDWRFGSGRLRASSFGPGGSRSATASRWVSLGFVEVTVYTR